jgi:hypothetical protein
MTDTGGAIAANTAPAETGKSGQPAADKPADAAKTKTATGKSHDSDDPPDIEMDDEGDVRIGNVIVNGDRIETDDRIIDENGVRPKDPTRPIRPGDPNFRPVIPPEAWKKMTPQQRQKLTRILRNMPQQPSPNTPPRPRQSP